MLKKNSGGTESNWLLQEPPRSYQDFFSILGGFLKKNKNMLLESNFYSKKIFDSDN